MSKVKYRIRAAAVKDLDGIWEYTFRKWSKDQADRYHGLIISEIEYVADNRPADAAMAANMALTMNHSLLLICVQIQLCLAGIRMRLQGFFIDTIQLQGKVVIFN